MMRLFACGIASSASSISPAQPDPANKPDANVSHRLRRHPVLEMMPGRERRVRDVGRVDRRRTEVCRDRVRDGDVSERVRRAGRRERDVHILQLAQHRATCTANTRSVAAASAPGRYRAPTESQFDVLVLEERVVQVDLLPDLVEDRAAIAPRRRPEQRIAARSSEHDESNRRNTQNTPSRVTRHLPVTRHPSPPRHLSPVTSRVTCHPSPPHHLYFLTIPTETLCVTERTPCSSS